MSESTPKWLYVQGSSNIDAIRYVAEGPLGDFGKLRILFHSGAEYAYDKVPTQLAMEFFESESKGKFFHGNISHKYEGVKVEEVLPEDVPISELFDESRTSLQPVTGDFEKAVEDSTVTFPVPYRDHA